jgi:uncharacterized membrane protein
METPPPQQPPQAPIPPAPPQAVVAPADPAPAGAPTTTGPIKFDIIGNAFTLVFGDYATWIVASLLAFIPMVVVGVAVFLVSVPIALIGGFVGLRLAALIQGVVAFPVAFVLISNMCRMARSALLGVKPNVNDVFKFEPNAATTAAIVGAIIGVGNALWYIPGIIAGGLLMLAVPISIDRKMLAKVAIHMSINAVTKDIVMACVFFFVLGICSCIPIFLWPIFPVGLTMLYRNYFGFAEAPIADAQPST